MSMREIYTLSYDPTREELDLQEQEDDHQPSWIGLSLGGVHLTLGFLSVVLGLVGLVAEFEASRFGSALWSGLLFEATGACGVLASRRWRRRSFRRCFCVASGLSAVAALLLFALTCVGVAHHHLRRPAPASVSANVIVLAVAEMGASVASAALAAGAAGPQPASTVVRETFVVPGACSESVPDVVSSAPGTLQARTLDAHAYEAVDVYF